MNTARYATPNIALLKHEASPGPHEKLAFLPAKCYDYIQSCRKISIHWDHHLEELVHLQSLNAWFKTEASPWFTEDAAVR
jgi:hypothetical protein